MLSECPYCSRSLRDSLSPWLVVLFLAALLVSGCNSPTGPTNDDPAPAGTLSPLGLFSLSGVNLGPSAGTVVEARWAETLSCSGLTAQIHSIPLVFEPFTITAEGAAAVNSPWGLTGGYYVKASREVHVVGDLAWSQTYKHEFLHLLLDLTYGDGDINHNSPLFKECGR